MRALLSTIGSRGDVQPLVALALELRRLGQGVRLCVPPDFGEWIDGLGLDVVPIGPELRTFTPSTSAPAAPLTPERRRQLAEASVATQFETVAAAAEGCDVIVAASALQIAARSVAERMALPYVFAAYCPIVLPSPHHAPPPLPAQPAAPATTDNGELWKRDGERFAALFGGALNAHRSAIGLEPVSDVRTHVFSERPWLAADAALAPWPDDTRAAPFQPGAWIVEDERPLPQDLDAFLDAGEPPIYFGFGSMRAPADLGAAMVESARACGRRAIVSSGWAGFAVADGASDCMAIGEANLRSLFGRVAAVVHHGGAGTTTLAALGGAPQVIVPQIYDQHYWAARIAGLGIGVAHAPGVPTTASLSAALTDALRPDVTARAQVVSRDVRVDGARRAAGRVIEVVAEG